MQADTRAGPVPQTDTRTGPGTVGGKRAPRATRAVIAAIAALVALVAAVVVGMVVGTQGDGDEGADRSPTTASTEPPSTAPSTTDADGGAATTASPSTSVSAQPVLEDGRHPVLLTGIDVVGRSVEFDLIQFLTGDEAIAAWDEAHPDDPGGPPNDYFIINDNPRLRRLPVADDVVVTVLDWDGGFQPFVVAFADLPAELAGRPIVDGGGLGANPFWLTVDDGMITAIEEQYTP
jgi:hypothetical protein